MRVYLHPILQLPGVGQDVLKQGGKNLIYQLLSAKGWDGAQRGGPMWGQASSAFSQLRLGEWAREHLLKKVLVGLGPEGQEEEDWLEGKEVVGTFKAEQGAKNLWVHTQRTVKIQVIDTWCVWKEEKRPHLEDFTHIGGTLTAGNGEPTEFPSKEGFGCFKFPPYQWLTQSWSVYMRWGPFSVNSHWPTGTKQKQ